MVCLHSRLGELDQGLSAGVPAADRPGVVLVHLHAEQEVQEARATDDEGDGIPAPGGAGVGGSAGALPAELSGNN